MADPTASSPDARELYLDDLQVGQVFRSGSMTVTEEAIRAFAAQFDPQPFHLDPEAAKASPFKGLAPSRTNPARGAVTVRNTTLNQRGEAVQVTEVKLLVPRREAGA